jgi:hypothetical protein
LKNAIGQLAQSLKRYFGQSSGHTETKQNRLAYLWLTFVGVALFLIGQLQIIFKPLTWKVIESVFVLLLNGIAMAVITVSIFELLKDAIARFLYNHSIRKVFDEFFGEGASSAGRKGVIILQSDQIDKILSDLAPDLSNQLASNPSHRLYKARSWINRFDADGARAIREEFQDKGFNVPDMVPIKRDPSFDQDLRARYSKAPFEIAMGLGHCLETFNEIEATCGKWMHIRRQTIWGDAVSLESTLLPLAASRFLRPFPVDEEDNNFRLLVPWSGQRSPGDKEGFDLKYWLNNPQGARDYAIILRHTQPEQQGNKQVLFVCAGFTEIGTAAAGHYLATKWEKIWEERCNILGYDRRGKGDFLLVIEGPSTIAQMKEWTKDRNFFITPEKLYSAGIDCIWANRLLKPGEKRFHKPDRLDGTSRL